MTSMWRKAMVYLGLGPDEEYDDELGDEVAGTARPPARPEPARPLARPQAHPESHHEEPVASPRPAAVPERGGPSGSVRPLAVPGEDHEPEPLGERPSAVRPIPSPAAKPHVVSPSSFNDVQEVADKFKSSQPVIVNLQGADRDLSRRLIDFASGLCYGLGGQMERVADQVYLLTPTDVEVSPEERRRLQERGLVDR